MSPISIPRAAALTCIDRRFSGKMEAAVYDVFGVERCAFIQLAGGAKNLADPGKEAQRETALDDINLVVEELGVEILVLLNHSDRVKYKREGFTFDDPAVEEGFHRQELGRAHSVLRIHLPGIEIHLGYAVLEPGERIRIYPVKLLAEAIPLVAERRLVDPRGFLRPSYG